MKNNSVQKVRKDLPFLEGIIYLDSASVSPAPVPVVESMNDFFQNTRITMELGCSAVAKRHLER